MVTAGIVVLVSLFAELNLNMSERMIVDASVK